jgi:phosphoribosylaminoimidazole-succinocarboxamide synthase
MGELGLEGILAVVESGHGAPRLLEWGFRRYAFAARRAARRKDRFARSGRRAAALRRRGGCTIGRGIRNGVAPPPLSPFASEQVMARRKKVYEGKAKILYEGPEPGTLIQYFKDDAGGAGRAAPIRPVEGKGVLNNRLSEFFMTGLNNIGVPTHFIRRLNMREQLVRMVEIIPLEVVVRNFAAGDSRAAGHPRGHRAAASDRGILPTRTTSWARRWSAEEHIIAFGWANQQDLDDIVALALRVNDFLSGVMLGVGVRLADFRIEVGRIWEGDFMRLIVADEISPDSCRLWDLRQPERPTAACPIRGRWPMSIPNWRVGWGSCPRTSPIRRSPLIN